MHILTHILTSSQEVKRLKWQILRVKTHQFSLSWCESHRLFSDLQKPRQMALTKMMVVEFHELMWTLNLVSPRTSGMTSLVECCHLWFFLMHQAAVKHLLKSSSVSWGLIAAARRISSTVWFRRENHLDGIRKISPGKWHNGGLDVPGSPPDSVPGLSGWSGLEKLGNHHQSHLSTFPLFLHLIWFNCVPDSHNYMHTFLLQLQASSGYYYVFIVSRLFAQHSAPYSLTLRLLENLEFILFYLYMKTHNVAFCCFVIQFFFSHICTIFT